MVSVGAQMQRGELALLRARSAPLPPTSLLRNRKCCPSFISDLTWVGFLVAGGWVQHTLTVELEFGADEVDAPQEPL